MIIADAAMQGVNKLVLVVAFVAVAAVGGALLYHFFAPESARHVDEEFPPAATSSGAAAPQAIKSGALKDGAPGHSVSGSVTLFRAADGSQFLRFEDYDQTQGPDVFLYLTPKPHADSTEEVEGDGLKVLVPGGAEGGESTLEGNFNVALPADFDAAAYNGLAVWCERFNVLFGYAELA